jgi:phage terminase small subunit
MQKLKPKQEAFALAFVETGNASEAYRRCYDVSVETKPNTIHVKACELLANEKVAAYVGELQAEHRKRHALTVDRIVAELSEVAFAEIRVNAEAELPAERWAQLHTKLDRLEKLAGLLGLSESGVARAAAI